LFGVNRSTLQDVVRPMDGFRFSPKYGRSYKVDSEQRTLGEYEREEQSGLADYT